MLNLGGMKQLATRVVGAGALLLKRKGPEIFTGLGIVFGAAATAVACKQTLIVVGVIDEAKKDLESIHEGREQYPKGYTEEDSRKDLATVYVRTGVAVVKAYAVPAGLGLLSIACILGGHRILRKENAAIAAAYTALSESFKEYRKRLAADLGDDKDKEYLYGIKKEDVIVQDENGNTEVTTKAIQTAPNLSSYARIFDENNPNCKKSPELTLGFLRGQQNYANDRLHADGYLFLNDVYTMLGFPRTEAGQYVGWIDGMGDSYVDFDIYGIKTQGYAGDNHCNTIREERSDFVAGYCNSTILDFNVDGIISDLFTKKPVKWKKDAK